MTIARPACRNVVAILHDPRRSLIIRLVAKQAGKFQQPVGSGFDHLEKIIRSFQCAANLPLDAAIALRLLIGFDIGAVIVRVPEAQALPAQ